MRQNGSKLINLNLLALKTEVERSNRTMLPTPTDVTAAGDHFYLQNFTKIVTTEGGEGRVCRRWAELSLHFLDKNGQVCT